MAILGPAGIRRRGRRRGFVVGAAVATRAANKRQEAEQIQQSQPEQPKQKDENSSEE